MRTVLALLLTVLLTTDALAAFRRPHRGRRVAHRRAVCAVCPPVREPLRCPDFIAVYPDNPKDRSAEMEKEFETFFTSWIETQKQYSQSSEFRAELKKVSRFWFASGYKNAEIEILKQ